MIPLTPQHPRDNLGGLVNSLNTQFGLDIPYPANNSPSALQNKTSTRWRTYKALRKLYYDRKANLHRILTNFEEWISGRTMPAVSARGPGRRIRQRSEEPDLLSDDEKEVRLKYLVRLMEDEMYMVSGGSVASKRVSENATEKATSLSLEKRRRLSDDDEEEFHTAPNSPTKSNVAAPSLPLDIANLDLSLQPHRDSDSSATSDIAQNWSSEPMKKPSTFLERLTASQSGPRSDRTRRYDPPPPAMDAMNTSFSTTVSSVFTSHNTHLGDSFNTEMTDVTEPFQTQSTYADSIVDHWLEEESKMDVSFNKLLTNEILSSESSQPIQEKLIAELLRHGPFSKTQPFGQSIPLRFRYELERIGRAWGIPIDMMLCGDRAPFLTHEQFWTWIANHSMRNGEALPDKSSRKAWDAAIGSFKTDKQSEVIVMTGDFDWCSESEPGILKLRLNPLKTEKTCRFHRRFGFDSHPSVLRESIASWLARHDHQCLGRTWRAFYVEEVKTKRKTKGESRFRVELFAVDGVDFLRQSPRVSLTVLSSPQQASDAHTPMTVENLLEWHMPQAENADQSNCKLFQRISLGLSKTWKSVVVRPTQILRLRDDPSRPRVMNDGCALMSRSLANQICDQLGISGATPSAFQGRIAGAKGLWMVDRYQSAITNSREGDDIWIQISDSQLKIHPHPQDWREPCDREKLTFEVVNWAKPLHPVDLNIQLLAILEHGGRVKEYIADLMRSGIKALYLDFESVLQSDSNVRCRALLQKLRPFGEGASKARCLDEWVANDAEFIIRLSEAGFAPRSFHPLRKRLRLYLKYLLDRHVEELHIQVPLSTYAYCIADPYGVLEPHQVHLGFSSTWRDPDGQFEDNCLDNIDVLVGRLPAHVPSDIQRRTAVYKHELRHFKDVIVFSTKGDMPLAHMLSGGDYDGDTPWVCWDQNIVQEFRNSDLPDEEFPAEHFGLTKHSVPMAQVKSTEDFLQSTFKFNLTMSNLGRCTREHEKIAYDQSIDCAQAMELACLLSHLVDGRKGGVHLSEPAWQQYRTKISPVPRNQPAYRDPHRKRKKTNIVDYLKFWVADHEKDLIMRQFEMSFPDNEGFGSLDDDLTRPWHEAEKAAELDQQQGGDLHTVLKTIKLEVDKMYKQWTRSFSNEMLDYAFKARQAVEMAGSLQPPSLGSHPLVHTWRHSRVEWCALVASYMYKRQSRPNNNFLFHAFGETLCRLKASAAPSRVVTNDIINCYRVNQKIVAHLAASEPPGANADEEETEADEYEGGETIEALALGHDATDYDDLDDGLSVE
ncbi:uncharacterized protein N7459_007889 [Penicillium hispanicum]|uniref:uncharacterized protein n=1 Tax=Penicillium hispanicum TaxID=1080232 RepID=UPI0025412DE2|nr:uncharacterized protein N7459_007889 [Penicillium hispanicum]KAJ5573462.1 hypothetical protein N7459_007889 [Penicillium hispanicum]